MFFQEGEKMNFAKKLIEVALPLDAINRESAREKSIRQGHPSTLHIWWARRPLAACRAVLFAQLVDDPSSHPEQFPTEEAQKKERERLFRIIENLVKWENINNEKVLKIARDEILKSTNGNPPLILDPFCGGGSIPLEAQRLGLKTYASDLNPIAVLITKALIEIPPEFAGKQPIHPGGQKSSHWQGAKGLAEDVRYYGKWVRNEAERQIGYLYPKVLIPKEYGGGQATVIAWLWTRTVKCPNPACSAQMPLTRSFRLSERKGREAWIEPVVTGSNYRFEVRSTGGKPRVGTVNRRGAVCLCCRMPVPFVHIRSEGKAGRISTRLMAIIVDGPKGRIYLPPNDDAVNIAKVAVPSWRPDINLPNNPRDFKTPNYGMKTFGDLFSARQLTALDTFSELVEEARKKILTDALTVGMPDCGKGINEGGTGATAYADAVATYLALGLGRSANYWSSFTPWGGDFIVQTFGRQAIPMVWDFAEANPFSESTGNWSGAIEWITKCLETSIPAEGTGIVKQLDATAAIANISNPVISTDPPYYDNICYADLSDFFYVWLRHSIGKVYEDLFSTLLTPKSQELIASPYRFCGDKLEAKRFFEEGLGKAFGKMRETTNKSYPVTIYYAFKQAESDETDDSKEDTSGDNSIASTGWETMLEGLLKAKFQITGTWPLRTERDQGLKTGSNVLASSVILACRIRSDNAPLTSP
jgi:putative DNA methylase